ncbi:hypothetical protein C0J52_19197 [Blattella germanica]|nr:hypothetical protein C0J52_19197 [Blattella germanica]
MKIIWTRKKDEGRQITEEDCQPMGRRKRGRPNITWTEGILKTMRERGLQEGDWEDREESQKLSFSVYVMKLIAIIIKINRSTVEARHRWIRYETDEFDGFMVMEFIKPGVKKNKNERERNTANTLSTKASAIFDEEMVHIHRQWTTAERSQLQTSKATGAATHQGTTIMRSPIIFLIFAEFIFKGDGSLSYISSRVKSSGKPWTSLAQVASGLNLVV